MGNVFGEFIYLIIVNIFLIYVSCYYFSIYFWRYIIVNKFNILFLDVFEVFLFLFLNRFNIIVMVS